MANRKQPDRRKRHVRDVRSQSGDRSHDPKIEAHSFDGEIEDRFVMLLDQGELAAALELWERDILPKSPSAMTSARAANAWLELGEPGRAIEILSRATGVNPEEPGLWLGLASMQLRSGDEPAAETTLRRGIRLHPDASPLTSSLAGMLYRKNRLGEATQLLEPVCDQEQAAGNDLLLLADIYRDSQRWPDAERVYRRLLLQVPDHIPALRGSAFILAENREYAKAIGLLTLAVSLDDGQAKSWFQLGFSQRLADDLDGAIHSFRRTIGLQPDNFQAREILGRIHQELGQSDQARSVFAEWLRLYPDHPIPQHMLFAMDGQTTPERASDEYVSTVFDDFAGSFESVLRKLQYQVPDLIRNALQKSGLAPGRSMRILDAGCGTGLCGAVLRPYARRLIGVDLSEKMLARANERGEFDELHHAELVAFLNQVAQPYDLIVSADTFNYFGNLSPVFSAARSALVPGGLLLFTLEQSPSDQPAEKPFFLNSHGRYSHHAGYVRQQLELNELNVQGQQNIVLRTENDRPVQGWLWTATA